MFVQVPASRKTGLLGGGENVNHSYFPMYPSMWQMDSAPEYESSSGIIERQWRAEYNVSQWIYNFKDPSVTVWHKARLVARGDQAENGLTSWYHRATARLWLGLAAILGWTARSSYKAHIYFKGSM